MEIAVSFLKSKYTIENTIRKINQTNAEYIHIDVMDGEFVPSKSFIYNDLKEIFKKNKKKIDIHLMVDNPLKYILEYKNLNPEIITIHSEINKNIYDYIDLIKSYNIKVGLSLKPKTSVETIEKYLNKIDNVLIMSVEPGKGGQKFMDSVLYKIDILEKLRNENNYNYKISIDGGINKDTIAKVKKVDFVISGSYVCMSNDYQSKINELRSRSSK